MRHRSVGQTLNVRGDKRHPLLCRKSRSADMLAPRPRETVKAVKPVRPPEASGWSPMGHVESRSFRPDDLFASEKPSSSHFASDLPSSRPRQHRNGPHQERATAGGDQHRSYRVLLARVLHVDKSLACIAYSLACSFEAGARQSGSDGLLGDGKI